MMTRAEQKAAYEENSVKAYAKYGPQMGQQITQVIETLGNINNVDPIIQSVFHSLKGEFHYIAALFMKADNDDRWTEALGYAERFQSSAYEVYISDPNAFRACLLQLQETCILYSIIPPVMFLSAGLQRMVDRQNDVEAIEKQWS